MKNFTTKISLSLFLATQITFASNNDKDTQYLITSAKAEVLAIMAQRQTILNDTHNGLTTSRAQATLMTNKFLMQAWQTSGKVSPKHSDDFELTKITNELLLEAVLATNLQKSPWLKK